VYLFKLNVFSSSVEIKLNSDVNKCEICGEEAVEIIDIETEKSEIVHNKELHHIYDLLKDNRLDDAKEFSDKLGTEEATEFFKHKAAEFHAKSVAEVHKKLADSIKSLLPPHVESK